MKNNTVINVFLILVALLKLEVHKEKINVLAGLSNPICDPVGLSVAKCSVIAKTVLKILSRKKNPRLRLYIFQL